MGQITNLQIAGMTCVNCAVHIEKALEAIPKVKAASVTLDEGARVEHDGADVEQLLRAVKAAGNYEAQVIG